MSAVFKADGAQTSSSGLFDIEVVAGAPLEASRRFPHAHPDDHAFLAVIEGTVKLGAQIAQQWTHAAQRSYVVIPGGTRHDFENRGATRAGFISINVPGGFEGKMPYIVQALTTNPVGDVSV